MLTFDPHPRLVLGYEVQLLTTFERRLELIEEAGPDEVLVVEFTQELSRLEPEAFVSRVPDAGSARASSSPARTSASAPAAAATSSSCARSVSTCARCRSSRASPRAASASSCARATSPALRLLLGRPYELEGEVVYGDQRGGTLGFPTANLSPEPHALVPAYGIYAGEALGHRVAASIGVNPHYGGSERRIEAFLLDFEGDLYGTRLRLELWERLRGGAGVRQRGGPRRPDRRATSRRPARRRPRTGRA